LPDVDRGARADAIEESWFQWQEGKREICSACDGSRLNSLARAVRLFGIPGKGRAFHQQKWRVGVTLDELNRAAVQDARKMFSDLQFTGRDHEIARDILPELSRRLEFLEEVGLGYLQLGRSATTLSGGEAQRIRLAAQLGSNLAGVLYVLDEPTIGLHSRDNTQLLKALRLLVDRGNSLLVVEHDEDTMRQADWILDLGPGAGVRGGQVVAEGTLQQLEENPHSITGHFLQLPKRFPTRGERRPIPRRNRAHADGTWLRLSDARENNLKDVTADFPLRRFVVVTGVSGSGKSTLVRECLLPALKGALDGVEPSISATVNGFEGIDAVYEVDQSPIGRTPRSVPATYVGFFDAIRELFSQTPEARMRGYSPSRFSFNSKEGRCPECEGGGSIKMEMNFLPAAYVPCESCKGTRFNASTLEIEYKGKNIGQVLEMSVGEAIEFFSAMSKIHQPLLALRDTGLDYLKLGQTSPTLSGGEAQRIKLVSHLLSGWGSEVRAKDAAKGQETMALNDVLPGNLSYKTKVPEKTGEADPGARFRRKPKHYFFILEEPTIGLHMSDVKRLVEVIQRLVDAGHSVVVIEHNLDLIAEADWVIDLGPEAGGGGGEIVATGTPEEVSNVAKSHTGQYLKSFLQTAQ
jgi:excinuclease ABC subunit A